MLVLFSFSITPKFLLHSILANHKDSPISKTTQAELSPSGFHCDVENLVVELPFLENFIFAIEPVNKGLFQTFQARTEHQFLSFSHFIAGLRGPPSFI